MTLNLADFPGLCVRHLQNGGNRVQATTKLNGVDLCGPCSKAKDVVAEQAKDADKSLAGRRFHKHARNCAWCLPVLEESAKGIANPLNLCLDGKKLWLAAVQETRTGGMAA